MALPHTAVRLYPVSVLYIECSPLFSKYLDIFFFFCHSTSAAVAQAVSVHPHRLCFGELCGVFESSPGQKALSDVLQKRARQLCKLSGLLPLLYKVFRCAVQHEQNQMMTGIDFLLFVHIKKYMVRVSSQKGK